MREIYIGVGSLKVTGDSTDAIGVKRIAEG